MTKIFTQSWNASLPDPSWKLDLSRFVQPKDLSRFFKLNLQDMWWTSAPTNIRPLRGEVKLHAVYELLREEGLPLVPAPRPDIVRELVCASDRIERRQVLTERRSDVLEDCAAVFAGVESSDRAGEFAIFALDAVTAFQAGAYRSAQALASAVTTTVLDDLRSTFDEAWKTARYPTGGDFPEELDEVPPYEFWVLAPLWHAYESANHGDLVDKWARHASIHEASEVHYNVPNAVISMMFLSALLDFIS